MKVYENWHVPYPGLWERFVLLFRRGWWSCDEANGRKVCYYFKERNGTFYCLKERILDA